MITEKQYLKALDVVKEYKKQNKVSSKRIITDDELRSFTDKCLDSDMIMRYTDLLNVVRDYFVVCRSYAVGLVKRLRDIGLVTQEGVRGLYLK